MELKLASCILCVGRGVEHDRDRSSSMMISRWSVLEGWMLGLMSQVMIGF